MLEKILKKEASQDRFDVFRDDVRQIALMASEELKKGLYKDKGEYGEIIKKCLERFDQAGKLTPHDKAFYFREVDKLLKTWAEAAHVEKKMNYGQAEFE